jgi:hypothetical protein
LARPTFRNFQGLWRKHKKTAIFSHNFVFAPRKFYIYNIFCESVWRDIDFLRFAGVNNTLERILAFNAKKGGKFLWQSTFARELLWQL